MDLEDWHGFKVLYNKSKYTDRLRSILIETESNQNRALDLSKLQRNHQNALSKIQKKF